MILRFGVAASHFSPGAPLADFDAALTKFLKNKPSTTLPIIVQGDVNAHFRWAQQAEGDTPICTDGKSLLFRDRLLASGLAMAAPLRSQQAVPTSRPRQGNRVGHHMDVFATQRVLRTRVEVLQESYKLVGTDHECLFGKFSIRKGKKYRRHATGPRVWTGGVSQVSHVDQSVLESLARSCTKPKPGLAYVQGWARGQAGPQAGEAQQNPRSLEACPCGAKESQEEVGTRPVGESCSWRLGGISGGVQEWSFGVGSGVCPCATQGHPPNGS